MRKIITTKRDRRKKRIRSKISGTAECPRLSVFRSNKYVYASLIDDTSGKVMITIGSKSLSEGTTMAKAGNVGENIADYAKKNKIASVVFDRNGYIYTGKVKALAESVRKAGLLN